MSAPRTGSGRAVIHGRVSAVQAVRLARTDRQFLQMYARNGTLVAVTSQEGVLRSNRRGPDAGAKL
jgi:hypothetical protein